MTDMTGYCTRRSVGNLALIFSCAFLLLVLPGMTRLTLAAGATVKSNQPPPISKATQDCLDCHKDETPGIVADWKSSRHSRMSVVQALEQPTINRRISVTKAPGTSGNVAVGCYECHGLNTERHKDSFDHNDYRINIVVSPPDCATCHPTEVEQFAHGKKVNAIAILEKNPLYHQLVGTLTQQKTLNNTELVSKGPASMAQSKSCFACHGTHVGVDGMKTVETEFDEVRIPNLTNWPNQGVGRHNPDGSFGSCTACHPRHSFSIEIARKPYTCAQCHLAPDVPAWEVFKESKHGNIFLSQSGKWNWDRVPWQPGRDFRTPTCSACHNALLADGEGEAIIERTHDFGSRLWVRIFGLPYSHPQPKDGKTWQIRNDDGLPLPVTFEGKPASGYLISAAEQETRQKQMQQVCGSCHSTDWSDQFFRQMDEGNQEVDKMVKTATRMMQKAWKAGLADPANPFDESLELHWLRYWLFYASSTRYGLAMSGPDYVGFKYGWWNLTHDLTTFQDKIRDKEQQK